MDSVTKQKLTADDIQRFVHDGLGPDVAVTGHDEFTDGYYNAAHAVTLADGRQVVLKVAPLPGVRVLRYEFDLMRTEIEFYERAAAAGVPLPRLWHADPEAGVMIMERLGGVSFEVARAEMSAAELLQIRRRIGEVSALITRVRGELFGYPRRDGRTRRGSWRESFLEIIADILADATELERDVTRPVSEVLAVFERHGELLDEVTEPVLVHFDLWDGNVFVKQDGDGWMVDGFIDGERALYGDPIAELVSMITFIKAEEEVAAVIDGYLGRPLTAREELRLCLYRCYLWLILVVEPGVRGYPAEFEEQLLGWVLPLLTADLARLDEAADQQEQQRLSAPKA
jgi:aminoglycoside phosphotransferase (APT) family kinase protein